MAGSRERPLGRPVSAKPLGLRKWWRPVSAPVSAKMHLEIPPAEMTATERWELDETEELDEDA